MLKKYIHQKLNDLHKELECPNEFIFDFIKDIQQDWDPDSYKSKPVKLQENQPKSKKFKLLRLSFKVFNRFNKTS